MSHLSSSSKVVISNAGLELNQQLDDHFKKSIEHIHASANAGGACGSQSCAGASWRDKQLPRSFFEPAASSGSGAGRSVNHSRDNSTDSSGRYTQSPPVSIGPPMTTTIVHSRAHSSPATLSQAQLSLAPNAGNKRGHLLQCGPVTMVGGRHVSAAAALPPLAAAPNAPAHQRFFSYDSSSGGANNNNNIMMMDFDDLGMLPDGWEKGFNAETGQHFYFNYAEKRPTLDDPRKCMSASHLHHAQYANQVTPISPQDLGPLPQNWEEAYTPDGHRYFINHNEQKTTWFDPRIPEKDQFPTVLQQRQAQQQILATPSHQTNQHKFMPNAQLTPMHQSSASAPSNSFGISRNLVAPNRTQNNSGTFSPNSQKRVQDLNQERRNYRLRQEEIMKQGLLVDSVSPNPLSPGHNLNLDPCLSYAAAMNAQQPQMTAADLFHMRQESGDSGVGMMTPFGGASSAGHYSSSGSSSHAHTPENFLGQPTGASDLTALNIAGIDLNFGVSLPMDVDTCEEIPQLNPNDLDQILNCRPPLRH